MRLRSVFFLIMKLCFLLNNSWISPASGLAAQQLNEISSLLGVPAREGAGGLGLRRGQGQSPSGMDRHTAGLRSGGSSGKTGHLTVEAF